MSPPKQASIVSEESDSAWILVQPILFANASPSFIGNALASPVVATCGMNLFDAATKRLWQSRRTTPVAPAHKSEWNDASTSSLIFRGSGLHHLASIGITCGLEAFTAFAIVERIDILQLYKDGTVSLCVRRLLIHHRYQQVIEIVTFGPISWKHYKILSCCVKSDSKTADPSRSSSSASSIFTIIFELVRHQKCLMLKIGDILTIRSHLNVPADIWFTHHVGYPPPCLRKATGFFNQYKLHRSNKEVLISKGIVGIFHSNNHVNQYWATV
jgi:hypothetical protein